MLGHQGAEKKEIISKHLKCNLTVFLPILLHFGKMYLSYYLLMRLFIFIYKKMLHVKYRATLTLYFLIIHRILSYLQILLELQPAVNCFCKTLLLIEIFELTVKVAKEQPIKQTQM